MKKSELIKMLEEIPGDPDVAICDLRRNLLMADGEASAAGIYPDFKVELIEDTEERDPARVSPEDQASAAWIALTFINTDLDELFEEDVRRCRVCGCTDLDCRQCIEKTGRPCSWVEEDLCSACVPAARILMPGTDF